MARDYDLFCFIQEISRQAEFNIKGKTIFYTEKIWFYYLDLLAFQSTQEGVA